MIKKFLAGLFCLLSTITGIVPAGAAVASAAETPEIEYTSVLYDLQQEENFDVADYPYITDDYSLQVITIAESVNDELFIYVYQPAGPAITLEAASINISTDAENVDTYYNYTLSTISIAGVFQKYKVNDFSLPENEERVYEISSIFRPFNASIDTPSAEGQTINEVSYAVGKRFKISADGMSATDIELITVTDKYVGFMRHFTDNLWTSKMCDVHYVAFSTDKKIENLLEADIHYTSQKAGGGEKWPNRIQYGSIETNRVSLSYKGSLTFENYCWFTPFTTEYPMISTASYFIKSEELARSYDAGIFNSTTVSTIKPTAKENISSKDWVLRFAVTDYGETRAHPGNELFTNFTIIGDVSVLRLKFETDGVIYNLGVVDNKQTGSREPSNDEKTKHGIDWKTLLIIVAVVLIVIFTLKSEGFRKLVLWVVKYAGHIALWPVFLTILIVQAVKGE